MTDDSQRSARSAVAEASAPKSTLEKDGPRKYSRREALGALGKYSAYVGTAGVVLLSAEDVVAQEGLNQSCFNQCIDNLPPRPDWLPPRARYPLWGQVRRCRRSCTGV